MVDQGKFPHKIYACFDLIRRHWRYMSINWLGLLFREYEGESFGLSDF